MELNGERKESSFEENEKDRGRKKEGEREGERFVSRMKKGKKRVRVESKTVSGEQYRRDSNGGRFVPFTGAKNEQGRGRNKEMKYMEKEKEGGVR